MESQVKLKSGETMECVLVEDPDDTIAPAIRSLLGHKGSIWQHHLTGWQEDTIRKLETRFHVGTIDGTPVGNIMTVEYKGLGIMGHVWTSPEHRRKGICDVLMDFHMDEFRRRKGTVLFLGTGYRSAPYEIYGRHGYKPVPGKPGSMWWTPKDWDVEDPFDGLDIYEDVDKADVVDLAWHHWPGMNILAHLPCEQTVRNVSYGVFGISDAEGTFLEMKTGQDVEKPDTQIKVLETPDGHIAGIASLAPDRRWGKAGATYIFDVFVHPDGMEQIPELVEEFTWPDAHVLTYIAESDVDVINALAGSGFHPHTHLERFFQMDVGLVVMDRDRIQVQNRQK